MALNGLRGDGSTGDSRNVWESSKRTENRPSDVKWSRGRGRYLLICSDPVLGEADPHVRGSPVIPSFPL